MPIDNRDWHRGRHPAACSCVGCNEGRRRKSSFHAPSPYYHKARKPTRYANYNSNGLSAGMFAFLAMLVVVGGIAFMAISHNPNIIAQVKGFSNGFLSPTTSATPITPTKNETLAEYTATATPKPSVTKSRVMVKGAYIVGAKYNAIMLINHADAHDPTYAELLAFLKDDPTDKQPYLVDAFVCADFAEMLHNNAEQAGIKAAYVSIQLGPSPGYPTGAGHALNAFRTTDRGMIFIDATNSIAGSGPPDGEGVLELTLHHPYTPEYLFESYGWRNLSMGTLLEVEEIQW